MPNFLSEYGQPYINSVHARLILTNEILRTIAQNVIENDGEGVTQRFAKDTKGGRINVLRVLPLTQEARSYGADHNGLPFPEGFEAPTTIEYGLDVLTIIDKPIAIRNTTKDMIPVNLLEEETKHYSQLVYRNINAMTVAGKVAKSLVDGQLVEVNLASTDATHLRDKFIEANAKLDQGDVDNAVDMFPLEGRVAVIRTMIRPYFFKANNIFVGGSNYAQDILAKGTLDTGSTRDQRNGFIGVVDAVPVYMAADLVWQLAEKYLGFPLGELDDVYGYISSPIANARGIALEENIKIVDAIAAQGILIQPDCRMGFEVFYPKGNVFLVKTGFVVPQVASVTTKILAPGSRLKPVVSLSVNTGTSAPVITVTLATGRTIKASAYFYSATATVKQTLVAFDTAYTAASKKAAISAVGGTTATQTGLTANYLYVKATDDLGNVTILRSTGTFTIA